MNTSSIRPLYSALLLDVATLDVASGNNGLLFPPNRSVIGILVVFISPPKRRRLGGSLHPC